MPAAPWRTRFAPAPTGYLHLGHAVNALWVWGLARAYGGQVLLRIEDHDRVRSRPEYETAILDDLDWLGLVPDLGATAEFRRGGPHPFRQSDRDALYAEVLAVLDEGGLVYPCVCSRQEIRRRGGVGEEGQLRYPGICRERGVDPARTTARRLRLAREEILFEDLRHPSPIRQVPAEQCGDLLLRDRDGHWSYQLAVVVDDLDQGIDVVIRGEDLLDSTGRQIQLARILMSAGLWAEGDRGDGKRPPPPRYFHHPLVLDPTGRKLSKSDGDTGLRDLRAAGWSPERVLGEAAHLAGLQPASEPLDLEAAAELVAGAIKDEAP